MAMKIIVNGWNGHEKTEVVRQRVADALKICCEDVVCLPELSLAVVDVPESMTKAREKADKEAADAKAAEAKAAEAKAADAAKAAAAAEHKAHAAHTKAEHSSK